MLTNSRAPAVAGASSGAASARAAVAVERVRARRDGAKDTGGGSLMGERGNALGEPSARPKFRLRGDELSRAGA